MQTRKVMSWITLAIICHSTANAAAPQLEGQWTTEYQIVDVSNSTVTNPNHIKALKVWIGHRYGLSNCVTMNDTLSLLRSPYPWDPRSKSELTFDEYGGFRATNTYSGGFGIPGHGMETIVGVIDGDRLTGIADIDLDWEGGTRIRTVLRATRSGPCK